MTQHGDCSHVGPPVSHETGADSDIKGQGEAFNWEVLLEGQVDFLHPVLAGHREIFLSKFYTPSW